MIQDPLQLAGGKIGIQRQSGLFRDHRPQAILLQPLHTICRTAALPYDGVVDGAAGFAVPDDDGFALVGNAQHRNILRAHLGAGQRLTQRGKLAHKDFAGVMLHPARLGENLGIGAVLLADGDAVGIENDSAGAGCSLI